jgi:hypothetical protein
MRDRYICGPLCVTVSCHPAADRQPSTRLSDVDSWWQLHPFSVLLPTGHAFDVLELPSHLGAALLREPHPRALGPVAVAPGAAWAFLVAPGHGLRPELAGRLDIVLHGPGSWIPAPPTRTPAGAWRWRLHPDSTGWRLPDPYSVQERLLTALRTNPNEPGVVTALRPPPARPVRRAA